MKLATTIENFITNATRTGNFYMGVLLKATNSQSLRTCEQVVYRFKRTSVPIVKIPFHKSQQHQLKKLMNLKVKINY